MSEQQETRWICGFWRRIAALIVDMFVLGAVGYGLGLVFEQWFLDLGGWGRLVGFVIALGYFGVLNSAVGNGQTLGKRLLAIRVVDATNSPISLPRSFVRYVVLGVPFFLNGIQIGGDVLITLALPLAVLIFGAGLSIVYLYVFNRVTRQSLHDLVVGTYVVNAGAEKQELGPIWRPHLVVVVLLFIISASAPVYTLKLTEESPFKEMLAIHQNLIQNPSIRFASVTDGWSTTGISTEESTTTTQVTVDVIVTENIIGDRELARRIARMVVAEYPGAVDRDSIQITLIYGFDIGIWSQWRTQTYSINPEELTTDL